LFYCESTDLSSMAEQLEDQLGDSLMTKLIWKPQNSVDVNDEQIQTITKLMDALESDDDVQSVHSNSTFHD